jgi:hypothetical protein
MYSLILNITDIQRKGLVLIQMLCEPSIIDKLNLCSRLIKVLTSTINKYNSDTGLLKEVCACTTHIQDSERDKYNSQEVHVGEMDLTESFSHVM